MIKIRIQLDYSELLRISSELYRQEEKYEECISSLDEMLLTVPQFWEGSAAEAYCQRFENLKPSFEETRKIIEILQKQIKESIMVMKERDHILAGKLDF
ncbi:WXG100 family type VII secretion target [Enterococcus sp. BWB1-3]|uniref:WXG100 family type VII secretion target n=1 Tax=unclassified Enterococcus TaxID=2608891 RepID=UPI0019227C22|nr:MULTISPECIES: WXG100 family type VII secretion target [unclassified Enterococcus]MBL1228563.1 WXG100 family type VII secretion target [Enterococcus sp. BWB1-3]MCB5950568.1 WXG100 family type VII secretion target [Enterococcus sp. BWT-B8]MCB5955893.1 WXG100 family type VII secretion target [Enterococcus sp. CWB-B31]